MSYLTICAQSAFCAVAVTGCMSSAPDLARSGQVRVTAEPSRQFAFPWTSVRQESGEVVISGVIARRTLPTSAVRGHVDLEVTGPYGQQLGELTASYGQWPMRGPRQTHYTARFKGSLPEGSIIRLKHRLGTHSDDES